MSVRIQIEIPKWWLDEKRPKATALYHPASVAVPLKNPCGIPPIGESFMGFDVHFELRQLECPERHRLTLYVAQGETSGHCAACGKDYPL